jgi:ribosomal protein S18 acetylase RimI-like enzyme
MATTTVEANIIAASGPRHIQRAVEIFREYEAFLDVAICFKGFEQELAGLPGAYAPPTGALLFSMVGDDVGGCVALCRVDRDLCEMKRLYVRPRFRRLGLGRALAQRVMVDAQQMGYRRMGLDTLDFLTPAIHLYTTLGFARGKPYYTAPRQGVTYMEIELALTGKRR